MRAGILATLATTASATAELTTRRLQGAQMIGGRPPKEVEMALCDIGTVFAKLTEIKENGDCTSGCAGGTGVCPPNWYPNAEDHCSADCGVVFEPFWDQCGDMLTSAGMGGMDEMSIFYDHCLQTLYPPGMCGTFCNQHTYDCYVAEVQESCCDEEGQNCVAGVDIPRTCPVGCAIVFPEFLETCRDHVSAQEDLVEEDFEAFEEDCLSQDGLALVEYALSLVDSGCILDLSSPSGRRLQDSGYLTQWLDASTPSCSWDEIDDIAVDVDMICCGADGSQCPASGGAISAPSDCTPACAVAMHSFTAACGDTLDIIMASDSRQHSVMDFEQSCLDTADSHFFLNAIMTADCSALEEGGGGH